MERLKELLEAWDEGHWEFTLVFEGLSDEDLWVRPHPALLSVGELAGHVAFNEAYMAEGGTVESPLVDERFAYYHDHVDHPVQLSLGVAETLAEVKKVHEAAKAGIAGLQDLDATVPWSEDQTWWQTLRYRVFHTAYHCGQAYSVRHLMGHTTTDN